ncbi:VOC family protein [Streptomyces sp. NPDC026673]|uniref:VOC family protein n=1 Tax=Streptomyces sp. NPDC026673 TaxID=3155724 RepID=UPI0034103930
MDSGSELIALPVSDVDRAKAFYQALGFRLDVDRMHGDGLRSVHFTAPGSTCSVILGRGTASAAPGSFRDLYLVVSDIERARAKLVGRGIEVSEVFHDTEGRLFHGHKAGEVVHHGAGRSRGAGLRPATRAAYGSYATFSDPDGNGWVLEEVNNRAPGS